MFGLIVYIVGCVFALIIGIYEMSETEKERKENPGNYDVKPQYGMLSVLVLLSWIVVAIWVYNRYTDKIHK